MIKLLLILLLSINIIPQQSGVDLLNKLQNKFNGINDLSAEFQKSTNGNIDLKGKFYYKKENKIRMELDNVTVISDGETVWNYNKNQNKVIISLYDEEEASIFSINNIIYNYPAECKITELEEDGQSVLKLVPEENSELKFNEVKLYLTEDNLIDKVFIEDFNFQPIEIRFSNYKINQNIPLSKFNLNPPEGSNVIDLR